MLIEGLQLTHLHIHRVNHNCIDVKNDALIFYSLAWFFNNLFKNSKQVFYDLIYREVKIQLRGVNKSHYDTFLKEFGMNLRRIRKEKGLSMESVANEAEIEYRQLGRIERGEVNTTLISLLRIAEVLKVDLVQFFQFEMTKNLKK